MARHHRGGDGIIGNTRASPPFTRCVVCYSGDAWPDPCPASPDPNSSVIVFVSWLGGLAMLTVIIIVAIILVALYIMRDRLPQLRR
jgi:hypothetical protein